MSALNLDLQRFLNEHDSLNAALNYHDKDLKGYLTTKDCTNMSASLFAQLDANKDGHISYNDMRSSLMKSVDEIQRRAVRIGQLRAEGDDLQRRAAVGPVSNFAVLSSTNESEIERISGDMMEHQNFLNAAWSFFHNSFGVHVFGTRPGQLQPQRLSLDLMRSAIACVSASATSDPLMEQEIRGLRNCGIDLQEQRLMQAEPYPQSASLAPMTAVRTTPSDRMQSSGIGMSEREKFASSQPTSFEREKMTTGQLAALAPVGTRGEGSMKESYEVIREPLAPAQHPMLSPLSVRDEQTGQQLPAQRVSQSALTPVALSGFQRTPPGEIDPKYLASQQAQEQQARSSPAVSRDYASSPAAEKDYDTLPYGSNLSAKEHESYLFPAEGQLPSSSASFRADPTVYDIGSEKFGSTRDYGSEKYGTTRDFGSEKHESTQYGSTTRDFGTTTMCLSDEITGSTTSDIGYSKGSDTMTLSRALGADPSPLMSSDFNKGSDFGAQSASSSYGEQQSSTNKVFIPIRHVEEEEGKY